MDEMRNFLEERLAVPVVGYLRVLEEGILKVISDGRNLKVEKVCEEEAEKCRLNEKAYRAAGVMRNICVLRPMGLQNASQDLASYYYKQLGKPCEFEEAYWGEEPASLFLNGESLCVLGKNVDPGALCGMLKGEGDSVLEIIVGEKKMTVNVANSEAVQEAIIDYIKEEDGYSVV